MWGLAIASVLTVGVHLTFGWLQSYRAITPPLLLAGSLATLFFFEFMRRRDVGLRKATGVFGLVGILGVALLWNLVPPVSSGILEFVEYMQAYTWSSISETQSIFNSKRGGVIGPLFHLGPQFVFGIGGLVGLTWLATIRRMPNWVVVITYAWFFWALSVVQVRFSVYLSVFNVVFAAIAFIHILSAAGFVRPISLGSDSTDHNTSEQLQPISLPDRRTTFYVGITFVLVVSLAVTQVAVFHEDITHGDERYQAAAFIDHHSSEQETAFPENYVFSDWATNRMYNHLVHGNAHSYHFARNNYGEFVRSTEPEEWYTQLSGTTGYVVTTDRSGFSNESLQVRLHEHYGSNTDETAGLGHYRSLYVTSNDSLAVFELVPGATITGTAGTNETIRLSTTATVAPAETEVTYNRRVQTDSQGRFETTVAYPGRYTVGGETVTVDEAAVTAGKTVRTDL